MCENERCKFLLGFFVCLFLFIVHAHSCIFFPFVAFFQTNVYTWICYMV